MSKLFLCIEAYLYQQPTELQTLQFSFIKTNILGLIDFNLLFFLGNQNPALVNHNVSNDTDGGGNF